MLIMRLLQFLLLFWLFYALVKALSGSSRRRPAPPSPEKTAAGEEMVQDPQCGTYVPRSLALEQVIEGKTCYFCSEKCRDAYRPSR